MDYEDTRDEAQLSCPDCGCEPEGEQCYCRACPECALREATRNRTDDPCAECDDDNRVTVQRLREWTEDRPHWDGFQITVADKCGGIEFSEREERVAS